MSYKAGSHGARGAKQSKSSTVLCASAMEEEDQWQPAVVDPYMTLEDVEVAVAPPQLQTSLERRRIKRKAPACPRTSSVSSAGRRLTCKSDGGVTELPPTEKESCRRRSGPARVRMEKN
eukprot:CAMPEP_0178427018 /NCGR_PEP_ID=MMETSP0689_2-20121128/29529_1 /TAXON_ID=160604 /ORGANISM="Amphidinium massartii, Strain CS-259" /LENGTH=118 /DNA_ID=CAMNT_0020048713 /DNA_START=88 /DNA_END=441 /DNA_ORIENTATION=+